MTKPTEPEVAAISTGERVTQDQIDALMAKFGEGDFDQHTEISHRYRIKLNIAAVKD